MIGKISCKFGGTSLASADNIRKVKAILERDPARRFVTVSAPGKRDSKDKKITDLLYLAHETARNGLDARPVMKLVRDRYEEIAKGLGIDLDLGPDFREIESRLANDSADYAASRGEYLQGRLMARYLKAEFVDPEKTIFFDEAGLLDEARTYETLGRALSGPGVFVVPGFYGAAHDGKVRTFSRGGSDISGAVVARAANVDVYENWTDVDGLYMTDPTVVKDPRPMPCVTYLELRELSYTGAKVLHDESIFPVKGQGIPIRIRNTFNPDHPGTEIVAARKVDQLPVVGIAGRKDFEVIYMNKTFMNKEIGFGRRLLEIIESYGISFEHMPSGIDSVSLVVSAKDLAPHKRNLLQDIQNILKVETLKTYADLALVAVVGTGMAHRCGIAAKIFSALAAQGINVRVIDQGASELTVIVGVDNRDFEAAVRAIYQAFVS